MGSWWWYATGFGFSGLCLVLAAVLYLVRRCRRATKVAGLAPTTNESLVVLAQPAALRAAFGSRSVGDSSIFDQHRTDTLIAPGRYTSRIDNHQNHQTPGGLWVASAPGFAAGSGLDHGASHSSEASALQAFVGDRGKKNRCAMTMRLSDRQNIWLRMRAENVGDGAETDPTCAANVARWIDPWPYCTIDLWSGKGRAGKWIDVTSKDAPRSFTFAYSCAPSCSLRVAGDTIEVIDNDGAIALRTLPPYAYALGDELRPCKLAVSITLTSDREATVVLTLDESDFVACGYRVRIDPISTIGASAIEDVSLLQSQPDTNMGAWASNLVAGATLCPSLVRVLSSALPSGAITGGRLKMYNPSTATTSEATAYRVTQANVWAESTCCWNWRASPSTTWAGAAGCATAGTDYETSGAAAASVALASWSTWSLAAAWFDAWKKGTYANNGVRIVRTGASPSPYYSSTEAGSNQPYFEIDWATAAAAALLCRRIHE